MKTKIKRHSRSVISVLLAVCMLVSCMTVGLIATDAARITSDGSVGDSIGNIGYVNFHGDLAGYSDSGNQINAWTDYALSNHDNDFNHFWRSLYTPASQTGQGFGWNIGNSGSDPTWGPKWFTMGGASFDSSTNEHEQNCKQTTNDSITIMAADSGWVKVAIDFWGKYGSESKAKFYQTAVAELASPTLSGAESVTIGNTITLTGSTGSGGTGSYSYSFSTTGGVVTPSDNTATFTANSAGTYTVTYTVTDANIPDLTESVTKEITVVSPAATGVSLSTDPAHVANGVATNITLTASATPATSADLRYTFYKGSTRLSEAQTSNTFTASAQTLTENTTYKVVVSDATVGTEYVNVEATATVDIAHDVYIYGTQFGGWSWNAESPADTIKKMTYDPTSDAYYYDAKVIVTNNNDNPDNNRFRFWDDTDNDKHYEPSSNARLQVTDASHTGAPNHGDTNYFYTQSLTGNIRFWFSLANKEAWITYPYDVTRDSIYALSGNVTDKYIVDSEVVKPKGISTNEWWAMYHPQMAVNNGSGDTYSITFTTTNYTAGSINIGLACKDGFQYGFVTATNEYLTADTDYTVPDAGVAANTMYVKKSVTGGSLRLKPNTTYTITIDQTGYTDPGLADTKGMITIDCTTVYANGFAMTQEFDINKRKYSDPEESVTGGTVTVSMTAENAAQISTTSYKGDKPATMVFTATPVTGYTFAGWYTDPECKNQITDTTLLSGTDNEILTETGVTVTHNRYALFREDKPLDETQHIVTLDIVGHGVGEDPYGTVTPVSGLFVVDSTSYKVYDTATAVFTATPKTAAGVVYTLASAVATSGAAYCSVNVNGDKITVENITANVTLTVTFAKKTTYTVTLTGTHGGLTAQAQTSAKANTGDAVVVTSGNTGTIAVPIGGYLVLTKGSADTDNEFINWNLTSGKYKLPSGQSAGKSPVTLLPTGDMTAEAVFGPAGDDSDYAFADNATLEAFSFKSYANKTIKNYTGTIHKAVVDLAAGTYTFKFAKSSTKFKPDSSQNNDIFSDWRLAKTDGNQDNYSLTVPTGGSKYTFFIHPESGKESTELRVYAVKGEVSFDGGTDDAPSTEGLHKIFAMNGVTRNANTTQKFGDTEIIIGESLLTSNFLDPQGNSLPYYENKDSYKIYYFDTNKDHIFRVQTTVRATYRNAVSVRGFVYNGKSVKAVADGNGVFHADISIQAHEVVDINGRDDVKNDSGTNYPILEVIPVYYNSLIADADYIKFYVDANSIDNKFGYNLGYSCWFANKNAELGYDYPGQPLMKEGSKYVGYLPSYEWSPTAAAAATSAQKDSASEFAGTLIDNLAENSGGTNYHQIVLRSWCCNDSNYQSFDYEDPATIYDNGADTIEFVAKYDETSAGHLTGTHWYSSYNKNSTKIATPGTAGTDTMPSNIEAPTGKSRLSGFELLRNFDNKPVDIYGNVIDGAIDDTKFNNSVFVVSVGNQTLTPNNWDTCWMVYQGGTGSHTLITGKNPDAFIGGSDAVGTADANCLANRVVYINYEKFLDGYAKDNNNTGDRIDGRWLYSTKNQATDAYIRVATVNKNGDTLSFIRYADGAQNARIAYYDDKNTDNDVNWTDGITQNGSSTKYDNYGRKTHFTSREVYAKAVYNQISGYKIVGFYMQKQDADADAADNNFSTSWMDYDEMTTESLTVAPFTNQRENRIVVVVAPIPKSNLYITHEMYGGEGAHYGAGQFYFKADVINSTGAVVKSTGDYVDGLVGYEFEDLTGVVEKGAGYKIRITLKTSMIGTNTLYQWYYKDQTTGDYGVLAMTNSAGASAKGKSGDQYTQPLLVDVTDVLYGTGTDYFANTNLDYYSDIDMGGTLHIYHERLTNPPASSVGEGSGRYLIKVDKVEGAETTHIIDETEDAVDIPSSYTKFKGTYGGQGEVAVSTVYKLVVYVKTVPDAYSTYSNTYTDDEGTTSIFGGETPTSEWSVAKEIVINSLYKNVSLTEDPLWTFDVDKTEYHYYTDLTTSPYKFKIQYDFNTYRDLYGDLTYATNNNQYHTFATADLANMTEATVKDENNNDQTSLKFKNKAALKAFVEKYAPYEDDFMKSVSWVTDSISNESTPENVLENTEGVSQTSSGVFVIYKAEGAGKNISIVVKGSKYDAVNVHARVTLPYQNSGLYSDAFEPIVTGDKILRTEPLSYGLDGEGHYIPGSRLAYGSVFRPDGKDMTAPEKIWNDEADRFDYFSYWLLKNVPTDDSNKQVEYAKCYNRKFNFSIYQDTIIEAVYENKEAVDPYTQAGTEPNGAAISFMENSRSQWNIAGNSAKNLPTEDKDGKKVVVDSWQHADRVYTDFLLSFTYNGLQLNTNSSTTKKYGIVVETVGDLSEMEEWGSGKAVATNYKQNDFATKFDPADIDAQTALTNEVTAFITDGTNPDNRFLKSEKYVTGLDNKNRINYYYALPIKSQVNYPNETGRHTKVYRAYSYLVDTSGGTRTKLLLSEPIYFTIYDISTIDSSAAL